VSLADYVHVSLRGLISFPVRSALMIFGMAISVAALISLLAIGQGTKEEIRQRITNVGTDLVIVRPRLTTQQRVKNVLNTTLTVDDAEELEASGQLQAVDTITYQTTVRGELIHGSETLGTLVTAAEPSFEYVRDFYVAEGRFINQQDIQTRAPVVVLGRAVADQFGGPQAILGEYIRIVLGPAEEQTLVATVIGVMEPKGLAGPFDQDDQAIIPITTAEGRVPYMRNALGQTNVHVILLKGDASQLAQIRETARYLMLKLHNGNEDFLVQTQEDLLQRSEDTAMIFSVLLGAIGGIALLVSAVGVAVAMLMIVSERTLEIGVRRAVGATKRAIMAQFLTDCVIMSVLGSAIGLATAVTVARYADGIELGSDIALRMPLSAFVILPPIIVSVVVSLVAGLFPAYRASAVSPIEALRA
jgi:putative ABC transport system permease protein